MEYDVVIIGSGPAGLTAAIYLARANKKVLVIEGLKGGQLTTTTYVENYPGFVKPILGEELMENFYLQAKEYGVEFIQDFIIEFEKKENFIIKGLQEYFAKSLIIATGSSPKYLGIEKEFLGKGVSTCATCDGNFFKKQKIAIIGGGNTALEEALYLSNICSEVVLIHRRTSFKAEKILQERVSLKKNITIKWPYQVLEFQGLNLLNSLKIQNVETLEEEILEIKGAFIAIGHVPNNNLLIDKVALNENGYVVNSVQTEISGLFVAGDIHDYKYRQAITAAGFGCMSAIECLKYLEN